MALQAEWKDRIRIWKDELKRQFYKPVLELKWDGCLTMEHLRYEQAKKENKIPFPAGTPWGKKWEYGWFFSRALIPKELEGHTLVLDMGHGAEGLIYLNGEEFGLYRADWVRYPHQYMCDLILGRDVKAGTSLEIAFEAYAGHGAREIAAPPLTDHKRVVPEPPEAQAVVGTSTIGIWNEEAYQLWLDLSVLIDIRNCQGSNSLRVQKIDEGLKEFTRIVDFEQDEEERQSSYRKARAMLQPLMACTNGSTVPRMYAFGHSHLDLAWLWPVAETKRKAARTFSNQLLLMDQYPDYRFLQSQPYLYEQVKQHYPKLYERICRKVKDGQIIPEGGMYVEAETNMTGGESLIRQFLYGKEFFKEEFQMESKLLWLPDVFGYTAALPQILKGCKVPYFTTQKILNPYNDADLFPYNYFTWRGIDGSEVTAFIHEDYNAGTNAKSVILRWDNRRQKENNEAFLYPFGYGDGGGGPTRDHLEYVGRYRDLEGVPKVKLTSPVAFFEEMEAEGKKPVPVYSGEIYYQAHRGVYTSQAKTKKGNRRGEFALRETEIWNTIYGNKIQKEELDKLWKMLLLNQFHDILPGSSIARVYEEAEKEYAYILRRTESMLEEILKGDAKEQLAVYNSLSWTRECYVTLPETWESAVDENGVVLPMQIATDNQRTAAVQTPGLGSVAIYRGGEVSAEEQPPFARMENEYLLVEWNQTGELTKIFDKEEKREYTDGACNVFCMYQDIPRAFDAWDIDSMYQECPVPLEQEAQITCLGNGRLYQSIQVKRRLNQSELTQEIRLYKNSRRLDFITKVDWRESHKLLKVNFPLNLHCDEMLNEIQFGYVKRPTHRSRQYDVDRYEVCNHKWSALAEENRGAALLNDCKYGISANDNSLNLTLLKSGKAPDEFADIGIQEFTYSLYLWKGSFLESDVIRQAYELNTPVTQMMGGCAKDSFVKISEENVLVEAVKQAQDGSSDVILRIYESKNASGRVILALPHSIAAVYCANMLEEPEEEIEIVDHTVEVYMRGFEIKTLRMKRNR